MPSVPQTSFFPPCFATVFAAVFLGLVAAFSYYYVRTPSGAHFMAMATSTSGFTTTTAAATPAPSPPLMVALRVPACPLALCEARQRVVTSCTDEEAATYCILDELRPVCSVGQCSDAGACESDVALATTRFQCDCRCDDGQRTLVATSENDQ